MQILDKLLCCYYKSQFLDGDLRTQPILDNFSKIRYLVDESSLSLDSWYANMRDFMVSYSDEIMNNDYYANVKALFLKANNTLANKIAFENFIKNQNGFI